MNNRVQKFGAPSTEPPPVEPPPEGPPPEEPPPVEQPPEDPKVVATVVELRTKDGKGKPRAQVFRDGDWRKSWDRAASCASATSSRPA